MSAEVRRDLGAHLQQQLGAVIERHCATADVLLSVGDVAMLIAEAAVSVTLSAAATAAANVHADGREEVFDAVLAYVTTAAQRERARSLATVAQRTAK